MKQATPSEVFQLRSEYASLSDRLYQDHLGMLEPNSGGKELLVAPGVDFLFPIGQAFVALVERASKEKMFAEYQFRDVS